jgi:TATA-binding protein-associated factor
MPQEIKPVVNILWNALLDLDDLTASTTSVMNLLSALLTKQSEETPLKKEVTNENIDAVDDESKDRLMTRVFPFLKHGNCSVRKSALNVMQTLMGSADLSEWLKLVQSNQLSHVYQSIVTESDDKNRELAIQVWGSVIAQNVALPITICYQLFVSFCQVLSQPSCKPIPQNLLVASDKTVGSSSQIFLGGALCSSSQEEKDKQAMKAIIAGTQALGCWLSNKLR